MRQQRTNNARGQVPFQTLATTPAVAWLLTGAGGTGIQIQPRPVQGDCRFAGVPQFIRQDAMLPPVSATWDGTALALTYATAIPPGTGIHLASFDSAWRSPTGGYLAPGLQNAPGNDSPPQFIAPVSGSSLTLFRICMPPTDGATYTPPAATFVGDWFSCTNSIAWLLNVTVAGVATHGTILPGENVVYTWDGAQWNGS